MLDWHENDRSSSATAASGGAPSAAPAGTRRSTTSGASPAPVLSGDRSGGAPPQAQGSTDLFSLLDAPPNSTASRAAPPPVLSGGTSGGLPSSSAASVPDLFASFGSGGDAGVTPMAAAQEKPVIDLFSMGGSGSHTAAPSSAVLTPQSPQGGLLDAPSPIRPGEPTSNAFDLLSTSPMAPHGGHALLNPTSGGGLPAPSMLSRSDAPSTMHGHGGVHGGGVPPRSYTPPPRASPRMAAPNIGGGALLMPQSSTTLHASSGSPAGLLGVSGYPTSSNAPSSLGGSAGGRVQSSTSSTKDATTALADLSSGTGNLLTGSMFK